MLAKPPPHLPKFSNSLNPISRSTMLQSLTSMTVSVLKELPNLFLDSPTPTSQNTSKLAKKLKSLLPKSPSNYPTNYLNPKPKLSNSVQTDLQRTTTNNNKTMGFYNQPIIESPLIKKPNPLNFEDYDEASSKSSLNLPVETKNYMNPTIKSLKNPVAKQDSLSQTSSNALSFQLSSQQKQKFKEFSQEQFKSKAKIVNFSYEDSNNFCQPMLEEPENLRKIEKHPRIRKTSYSKADKLIKAWLDVNGKLTEEQAKILGSSGRVQKKTIYYFINQMEERQIPLQLFIDKRLLNKKKFTFASKIITFGSTEPHKKEILNNLYEMFTGIKELNTNLLNIKLTITQMKAFIEIASKFSYPEISSYIYKFFAKMLTFYSEFYNAHNLNKTAYFLAKTHNLHYLLMTLHKRLGKLNRKMNKNRVALKHFLRMLNFSWFLDNDQYEFLAYDEIGLSFYYLNELEKANFYHLRMLDGEKEAKNSVSRALGVLKIKTFLEKNRIHDENLLNLAKESSDEEEEVLFAEEKSLSISKKDKQKQKELRIFLRKETEKFKEDNKDRSFLHGESKAAMPRSKEMHLPPQKFHLGNREVVIMEKTMVFEKKTRFISHLSRNRHLLNFYEFNTKSEENDVDKHREIFRLNQLDVMQKVDAKDVEVLKKMVKKLKNNLEICILYMETLKNKGSGENRRTGMLLRPMK